MIKYLIFVLFIFTLLIGCQNSIIVKKNAHETMSFDNLKEHYKRSQDIFIDFFEKSYTLEAVLYNSKLRDSFNKYKKDKKFNSTIFEFDEKINEDLILLSFFSPDTKTKYLDHKNSFWTVLVENETGECSVEKIEEIQDKVKMVEIFFNKNHFSDFYRVKFVCPKKTERFIKLKIVSLKENLETLWEFENGSI